LDQTFAFSPHCDVITPSPMIRIRSIFAPRRVPFDPAKWPTADRGAPECCSKKAELARFATF
ncbi:MAG: hypothetical protein K2H64_07720, partial [Desulfovibrio sp.]|nr:hypothetical protein [Desulfovibrio sp.]